MEQGIPFDIAPGLRGVLCPNPSAMTYNGTITYLIGSGVDVAVIDPGPDLSQHQDAICTALAPGQSITAILVTHAHLDHSPGARPLSHRLKAPVYAFGPATAGRRPIMETLALSRHLGGGEGVDMDFAPDHMLAQGDEVVGDTWRLRAHWTPGHMANHLSFEWCGTGAIFTGDVIMGWAASLISPPDGDLDQFYESLDQISALKPRVLYPGHGPAVLDPPQRIAELRSHRLGRTAAILRILSDRPTSLAHIAALVYMDIDPNLMEAAQRNLLAHLISLTQAGAVMAHGPLGPQARFSRAPELGS